MTKGKTILDQLIAMDKMAVWAWGSHKFIVIENGLQFKVQGPKTKKGAYIEIKVNGRDLYDVKLKRNVKKAIKVDSDVNDIFVDQLIDVIDHMVG